MFISLILDFIKGVESFIPTNLLCYGNLTENYECIILFFFHTDGRTKENFY